MTSREVLVFEDNLMWSSRLVQTLKGLGYEPVLCKSIPTGFGNAKLAIVNLGSPTMAPNELVPLLRSNGIHVIGHAGHKEKEILELGRIAGCDTLTTNSELTFKIEGILNRIFKQDKNQ